jgi:hypothetical protein
MNKKQILRTLEAIKYNDEENLIPTNREPTMQDIKDLYLKRLKFVLNGGDV